MIASRFARILWGVCAIPFHAGIQREHPRRCLSPAAETGYACPSGHCLSLRSDSMGSVCHTFSRRHPQGSTFALGRIAQCAQSRLAGTCGAAVAPYGADSLGSGYFAFALSLSKGAPPPKAAETGYACPSGHCLSLHADSMGSVCHTFSRRYSQGSTPAEGCRNRLCLSLRAFPLASLGFSRKCVPCLFTYPSPIRCAKRLPPGLARAPARLAAFPRPLRGGSPRKCVPCLFTQILQGSTRIGQDCPMRAIPRSDQLRA